MRLLTRLRRWWARNDELVHLADCAGFRVGDKVKIGGVAGRVVAADADVIVVRRIRPWWRVWR